MDPRHKAIARACRRKKAERYLRRRRRERFTAAAIVTVPIAVCLALMSLVACDPMTKPTKTELESDARTLFENKIVVKDPGSNLCVVILDGEYAKRPIFQIFMVRCKSEKHLLEPVAE